MPTLHTGWSLHLSAVIILFPRGFQLQLCHSFAVTSFPSPRRFSLPSFHAHRYFSTLKWLVFHSVSSVFGTVPFP